jgi:FKBP-type peptidyl-prolyl cis-trans isomerase FklB
MRKLLYIFGLTAALASCDQKAPYESTTIENGADSLSYSFGYSFASRLASDTILTDTIQMDAFMKGVSNAINQEDGVLSEEEMQKSIESFVKVIQEQMRQKQEPQVMEQPQTAQIDASGFSAAGEAFLAENKTKEGVIEIENGIQYKVITEGTGASPTLSDQITIHYHGTTIDGKVFDSSVEKGKPASFPLGGLIPGWQKVLPLMKEGSKWEIFLPYQEAYGERGAGRDIPPYSALIFEIELIKVN